MDISTTFYIAYVMITRYKTIFKHELCSVLAKILLISKQDPSQIRPLERPEKNKPSGGLIKREQ